MEINIPLAPLEKFSFEKNKNKSLNLSNFLSEDLEFIQLNEKNIQKKSIRILNNFPSAHKSNNFNPLLVFDLHPFLPIKAVGSFDKGLRFYNFFTNELICEKFFQYEITSIKFNSDGKIIAIGFINGSVLLLDSHMTEKNYLQKDKNNLENLKKKNKKDINEENNIDYIDDDINEEINFKKFPKVINSNKNLKDENINLKGETINFEEFDLYHKPKLELLQIIPYLNLSVILINFSKNDDFLAISYNNKISNQQNYQKNNKDNYQINYDFSLEGGSIVSLFVFKLSLKSAKFKFEKVNFYNPAKNAEKNENKKSQREEIYIKLTDISVPSSQYESKNLNRNECATTSLNFSDDSDYILLENQPYKKNIKTKKDSIYLIWDIENRQLVLDRNILKKLKFSNFSFSNSIEAIDLFSYLNYEHNLNKQKLKLIKANVNKTNIKSDEVSNLSIEKSKTFTSYNLSNNKKDYFQKDLKNLVNDQIFFTSCLPLLKFNFDYEFEISDKNTQRKIQINKTYSKRDKHFSQENSNKSKLTLQKNYSRSENIINQHITCGGNDGSLNLFRLIYLLEELTENEILKGKIPKNKYDTSSNIYDNSNENNSEEQEFEENEENEENYFLRGNRKGVSRSFVGHCSKINLIKSTNDENFIFTSDQNDSIILQWKLKKDNINSDLDNFPLYFIEENDPFADLIEKEFFITMIEDYWIQRSNLRECYKKYFDKNLFFLGNLYKENLDKNINPIKTLNNFADDSENNISSITQVIEKESKNEISVTKENDTISMSIKNAEDLKTRIKFNLKQIIGRRAIDRRNNLFCDGNNKLIYFSATNIIFTKLNNLQRKDPQNFEEELQQSFLIPVENLMQNTQNEISCINLSEDKQLMVIGINGLSALICVYELNTLTNVSKIFLKESPCVNLVKFSTCKEKIIAIGINKFFYCVIYVINFKKNIIETSYLNSGLIPYKIKDVEFDYKNPDVFFTCGIQHLCMWENKGKFLVNTNIPLKLENNKGNFRNFEDTNEFYIGKKDNEKKKFEKNNKNLDAENSEFLKEDDEEKINKNKTKEFEEIKNFIKNKNFGIFLVDDKEKVEEFINYNFCSRENYFKYYLNPETISEKSYSDLNSEEIASREKKLNKFNDSDFAEEYDNEEKYSLNRDTIENERENLQNNFYYNYYFANFIHVSFICIRRINKNFLLAADDGFVYLMQDRILKNKIPAHSSYISAMEISLEDKVLITGGIDGKINIFNISIDAKGIISNIYLLKSVFTYDNDLKDIFLDAVIQEISLNVQSLCIINKKIIVGTRNGNIMEYDMNSIDNEKEAIKNKQNSLMNNVSKNFVNKDNNFYAMNKIKIFFNKKILLNFFDDHPPIDIAIDNSSKRIFCISEEGLFFVYDHKNLKLLFINDFNLKANKIYHFKYSNKLLIAFDSSVIVLDTTQSSKTNKDKMWNPIGENKEEYNKLSNFDLNTGTITDLVISQNEKLLAIASVNNSSPQLYIYDISQGFIPRNLIQNFNTSIRYLDFSNDGNYLLVEDNLEEYIMIEIHTKKIVNSAQINFQIEWNGQGLKYSNEFKSLHKEYLNDMSIITVINKHPSGKFVAVGDELGAVKIFSYPSEENEQFFYLTTNQNGKILNIVFSSDNRYMLTCSEIDRTVHIYEINITN